MSANLIPFTTDGGIITNGDIIVGGLVASPAPSISGFDSASFSNAVVSGNVFLNNGYIQGGVDTVVTDGINSIQLALGAQMDVYGFPFSQTTRGRLTISDVTTPAEVNGTWYYQSTSTNAYQIYTNSTYSTLVDATGWSAYTGGGNVSITKNVPAANITIDTNGYLTKFDNTGNLTLPGNLNSATNLTITVNTQSWTFGTNGVTTNPVITFANLPLATTPGLRAFISDGNLAPIGNFGVEVSGGGGNYVPVFSDGANWCIG